MSDNRTIELTQDEFVLLNRLLEAPLSDALPGPIATALARKLHPEMLKSDESESLRIDGLDFYGLVDEAGWNDDTMKTLAFDFISNSSGRWDEFENYLRLRLKAERDIVADEEADHG